MRAWIVSQGTPAELGELSDDDLPDGDVVVDVLWSSINFKDALALRGDRGVVRSSPLVPGIDVVGEVRESAHPAWAAGDLVILNGWGAGERTHGGLAERARVDGARLVRVPDGMSGWRAAAIGTAGLTAMLAAMAIESTEGDVLVTGASGGVGSLAIAVLADRGRRVIASTGRPEGADRLRALGAADVIERSELEGRGRPLESARWAAAIDSVGGETLANALAHTSYGGVVAACGLAGSPALPATVMPFILRAVSLVGINSVECPMPMREEAWTRLAAIPGGVIDDLATTVPLAEAGAAGERLLAGGVRGRVVVDVRA